MLNPAVLAISIALLVIAGVFAFHLLGQLNDFPGSATARKLLTVAGSTRSVMLDPVSAEAGTLSDLFFMKHGLEHYDVPDEFADFQTIGCRVLTTTSRSASPKSGWARSACSFFFSRQRETARPGPCWRFRVGVMSIRKAGSVQSRNTTVSALWLRSGAVRKSLEPYLSGPQSNRQSRLLQVLLVPYWPKSQSKGDKSKEIRVRGCVSR